MNQRNNENNVQFYLWTRHFICKTLLSRGKKFPLRARINTHKNISASLIQKRFDTATSHQLYVHRDYMI